MPEEEQPVPKDQNHVTAMSILEQESVAHYATMNRMREMVMARAADVILSGSSDDNAARIIDLLGALNSGQQGVKSAQTTPPETGEKP